MSVLFRCWVYPSVITKMRTLIVLLLFSRCVVASDLTEWPGSDTSHVLPGNMFTDLIQRSKRSPIGDVPLAQHISCKDDFPKMKKVCDFLTDSSEVLSVLECLQSLKVFNHILYLHVFEPINLIVLDVPSCKN